MTTRRTLLSTGAAVFAATVFGAQPSAANAAPGDLQAALDQISGSGRAAGALAELRWPGGVRRGGSGVARLGSPQPVPVHGRFRAGSVTKAFVASVVMQLVAEQRLGVDEPLRRRLPDSVPADDRITLRHLLQHTSGVPDYTDVLFRRYPTNVDLLAIHYRRWTPQDLIALANTDPRPLEPGAS